MLVYINYYFFFFRRSKREFIVLIPRYARVNEHKTTVKKAIEAFQKEGFTLIEYPENLKELQ